MLDDRSVTASDAVTRCLDDVALDGSTARRFFPTVTKFASYLDVSGITSLDAVTVDLIETFVRSRLDSGQCASLAAQHNRRTALRFLFRVARRLELATGDPTLDIRLPPATSLATRPLVDEEIELCRDIAWWASSRVAAAWALAEATARGSEIASVSSRDIDLDAMTVRLSGGARTEEREGSLTGWGADAFRRRMVEAGPGPIAYGGGGKGNAGQVSTCRAISTVLVRAGLAGEPDVRPASVAGWAGRRVFDSSGSIEEAALAMGVRSLDRAARLIGLDWADRG